jgi:predicted  nucleic acid-binding Zn-ribbon protein
VFYAKNREQIDIVKGAEDSLKLYATPKEQISPAMETYVSVSKSENQSVASYLISQIEDRNKILTGNPSSTTEEIRAEFQSSLSSGRSIAVTVVSLKRSLDSRQEEVEAHLSDLAIARSTIRDLEQQLTNQTQSAEEEVQVVKEEWQDVQDESIQLNSKANDYFTNRGNRDDRLRGGYQGRIQDLGDDVDFLRLENARLESTIVELRDKIDSGRMSVVDPSTLIDGTVLEVSTGDEVFIDRGFEDRIELGMTFEIYDSHSQLREDINGVIPRGKASIEVVKVGKTTSTAKITRSTSSQPIVRDNIIVNAVYDPNYKYSFLVHGEFDADGDGLPESNNRFIKDQIERWGGKIIEDEGMLPGDLDFLVLGITPQEPIGIPPPGASEAMEDDYARRKRAFLDYEHLLDQARAAQVPVLTSNRFLVLTGQRDR